jgi:hypothetical protein
MAETVRNPIGSEADGIPDRAILSDHLPATIVVEVIVTGDATAYVFGGGRSGKPGVALLAPFVKAIQTGHRNVSRLNHILAGKLNRLAGLQSLGYVLGGDFQAAAVDGYQRKVAVGIGIRAIGTGRQNR